VSAPPIRSTSPEAARPDPVVVVLARDGIAPTARRACLAALAERTRRPFDLVVVEGTAAEHPARALNEAIARFPGRAIVRVCANVVVETEGWLERLLAAAERPTVPAALSPAATPSAPADATRAPVGVVGCRLVGLDRRQRSAGRSLLTGLGVHPRHVRRRGDGSVVVPAATEDSSVGIPRLGNSGVGNSGVGTQRAGTPPHAAAGIETQRSTHEPTGPARATAPAAAYPAAPAPAAPVEVDSVEPALALFTADALARLGGAAGGPVFDEGFDLGVEQDDACLAARFVGFDVVVCGDVAAVELAPHKTATTVLGGRAATFAERLGTAERAAWRAHAERFRAKWGFDPRYPDLDEIRRLYGDTRICWRLGERMRWRPSAAKPRVDVAIVTWNNREVLLRCLESLAATEWPHLEVHIADNGSTDGTREALAELRDRYPFPLHVHALPCNAGVPVGFNTAILAGSAELVARLDDDVVVPPEWLSTLVETMQRRPYAGCVGPKIVNDDARRTIQCGPFRFFPDAFAHGGEDDVGQADYVARCVHVRGCCNLYRRSALEDAGLFDLRFSPSQWDDPEHHVALQAAGYEVVYDGRTAVVHAVTSGRGRSWAAVSNEQANRDKLDGKWGEDVFLVLDRALDHSRLGRLLPESDEAWARGQPDPSLWPRTDVPASDGPLVEQARKARRFEDLVALRAASAGEILDEMLELARIELERHTARCAGLVHALLDVAPVWPEALCVLGHMHVRQANPAAARDCLRWAERLVDGDAPERARLATEIERLRAAIDADAGAGNAGSATPSDSRATPRASTASASPTATGSASSARSALRPTSDGTEAAPGVELPRVLSGHVAHGPGPQGAAAAFAPAGRTPAAPLRVLMASTFRQRHAGGDHHQVRAVAEALRTFGVDVEIADVPHPDARGFDLAHVHNLWFPHQTLPQVQGLRARHPALPLALTPIWWCMREKNWTERAIGQIARRPAAERPALLEHLADGRLTVDGTTRAEATTSAIPQSELWPGFEDGQARIAHLVDHWLPQSEVEARLLAARTGAHKPATVVPNGVDHVVFAEADPGPGRAFLGLPEHTPFVATAGLVEPRKNQLLLIHALAGTGIPLVVVGKAYDRDYLRACRDVPGIDVRFVDHVERPLLASILAAARVFALPSFMECASIASLEAGVAGCSLVVGDRTSEAEVYGDTALRCDPANIHAIRAAVRRAFEEHDQALGIARRTAFRDHARTVHTWEFAALRTLTGYVDLLEAHGASDAAHRARAHLAKAEEWLAHRNGTALRTTAP
jgi:GT2 family glycosyltransferase/glycosyltransferase involved in cell wall biosynthesis